MNVTLFVPVLNEIEGLKLFMPQIPKGMFHQIMIVDGRSEDGSAEWARQQGYDVLVQEKRGVRLAYTQAWPHITGDYVVAFSPDGNCKISDMPVIIDKLKEGYDMVIASRYYQGAKSEDDDWLTGFGNWMFRVIVNALYGGHLHDVMTMYRGYRKGVFYELDLHKDETYAPERLFFTCTGLDPMATVRCLKRGLKIAEIPSDEPKRLTGQRKLLPFRWGATVLLEVLRELYYWK